MGNFWERTTGLFPLWFDSGYMFLRRVAMFMIFYVKRDLGSRGPAAYCSHLEIWMTSASPQYLAVSRQSSIFCPALWLSWPRSLSTTAVIRALLVVLVTIRLVLCSLRLSAGLGYGQVCTIDASVAILALSPYLTDSCSPSGRCLGRVFGSPRWLTM